MNTQPLPSGSSNVANVPCGLGDRRRRERHARVRHVGVDRVDVVELRRRRPARPAARCSFTSAMAQSLPGGRMSIQRPWRTDLVVGALPAQCVDVELLRAILVGDRQRDECDAHERTLRPRRDRHARPQLLRAGRLVAFPTETVYGLGADATSSPALQRLYAVKGRPAVAPRDRARRPRRPARRHRARTFPMRRVRSSARVWPGPLTLVVRRRPGVRRRRGNRRSRHGRRARARPSARARVARRVRRSGGRTVGEPVRPREPDDRRARARRSRTATSTRFSTAARAPSASSRRSSTSRASRRSSCASVA